MILFPLNCHDLRHGSAQSLWRVDANVKVGVKKAGSATFLKKTGDCILDATTHIEDARRADILLAGIAGKRLTYRRING
jgi:hypothetical protein